MRPSLSVTLEPGLEQGIPWGRDLYTFVTSAAGHMMRTLQKPRKNRPSKRQVNHRRFLHNMIQRKFADIEAANHRLASALYFKDEEKTLTSPQSQRKAAAFQSGLLPYPEKGSDHIEADDISKSRSDASVDSQQTEVSENNHPYSPHLQRQPPNSQPNCSTSKQVNQANERKAESGDHKLDEFPSVSSPEGTDVFHTEYYSDESPIKSINNLADETLTALQNSSFIQFDPNMNMSPACSPELSPLSLDSCDFSIQMFTDISSCTQTQKSIIDIAESPWADIMDLFSIGNKDIGDSLDVGAFQGICACQDDVGQDVNAENQSYSFTQRMRSNTLQMEELHYQSCEYRHSSQEDQESTLNEAAETQFNNFRLSQGPDITQNQLPVPISCHYNVSHLPTYQHPQQLFHCIQVNCENNRHLTPFEGVAQSFSAPLPNPEYRPIPTPPHENDWLFPDILKERTSPDCQECVFGARLHCDTSL